MRKVTLAMQTSLDGFVEGPNRELDSAMEGEDEDGEIWNEVFDFLDTVDTCVLGRVMYPDYERYWLSVLANPDGPLPLRGKPASEWEIRYARWADETPHVVVSRTLDQVAWMTTRIVRDAEEIQNLKQQPGNGIYVVGGATLASSLMNLGLIDELRVTVNPLLLGQGKSLLKDLNRRHALELTRIKELKSGQVGLTYAVRL